MTTQDCARCEHSGSTVAPDAPEDGGLRIALIGNPNTGKTTLFNRLCGLRHKTSNFPGTTQEARVGAVRGDADPAPGVQLVDLPGVYSLHLEQGEAAVCREVLAGNLSPKGERTGAPDAVCVVADANNLGRNLTLVGEVLAQRLPTVVAVNMIDLARRSGTRIDGPGLEEHLGCRVVLVSARSGEGVDELGRALRSARIPNRTPPGDRAGLEHWADAVHGACVRYGAGPGARSRGSAPAWNGAKTDRVDAVLTHPVLGTLVFAAVMAGLFAVIFKLAAYPMDWIELVFAVLGGWVKSAMPPGILSDLLSDGVVGGIGATVVFLPQICLLFFLISLLEDTGYLARAAFVMNRVLRPFGLPGHSFVPLLSSHACALPGIMATRAIPDRRDRLATILVAPFMTCSARIPVYVLLITVLFKDRPTTAALVFVGCYALGIAAGLVSALVARRTILRGPARAMVLELPSYKVPSLRTAALTTVDRAWVFVRNAGTNILAICVVLWWLSAFPRSDPPPEATAKIAQAAELLTAAGPGSEPDPGLNARSDALVQEADRLTARHALEHSFAGRLGRFVQPVFGPLGYDWQLTVGVLTSFAAREVFVSTMGVMVAGNDDAEDEGVVHQIREAKRSDGVTPIFTPATSWSLLVFYVLAMQCLPTLAVTAKEAGGVKWALLQLTWMSAVAYAFAWGAHALAMKLGA